MRHPTSEVHRPTSERCPAGDELAIMNPESVGDTAPSKLTLGSYLWSRIAQLGVETIFGVPGDFNLQFLDSIYTTPGLKFITNQNELNAAYAADGYARVKNVPGCFVTTHGVGELSALNGVAGAMSENVKMIHVVGQTTRAMQKNHMMIHHSIGRKPDHQLYNRCSEPVRVAAAELWDIETAPAEIDRVIRECFIKSGPVYIFLPLDLSAEEVDAKLLDTPIDIHPHPDSAAQKEAVDAILTKLAESKHPSLLIDALVHRFNAVPEATALVKNYASPFSPPTWEKASSTRHLPTTSASGTAQSGPPAYVKPLNPQT